MVDYNALDRMIYPTVSYLLCVWHLKSISRLSSGHEFDPDWLFSIMESNHGIVSMFVFMI